jgi:DnaJ like chaperone protein
MKQYAKWIGGGLGFALGGPLGAILGYAVGSMIGATSVVSVNDPTGRRRYNTTANDFVVSLLVLSAAIMKADGKVLKSELEYVKRFLAQQFGEAKAQQQLPLLRDILEKPIPLREVCEQIRANMQHPLRLQLMHYLFGLANADGSLVRNEVKILEIEESATEAEIKKAYRKMAVKYHPDKVSTLGEEFQKAAREKFVKVQEAYEIIKKQRGIK